LLVLISFYFCTSKLAVKVYKEEKWTCIESLQQSFLVFLPSVLFEILRRLEAVGHDVQLPKTDRPLQLIFDCK